MSLSSKLSLFSDSTKQMEISFKSPLSFIGKSDDELFNNYNDLIGQLLCLHSTPSGYFDLSGYKSMTFPVTSSFLLMEKGITEVTIIQDAPEIVSVFGKGDSGILCFQVDIENNIKWGEDCSPDIILWLLEQPAIGSMVNDWISSTTLYSTVGHWLRQLHITPSVISYDVLGIDYISSLVEIRPNGLISIKIKALYMALQDPKIFSFVQKTIREIFNVKIVTLKSDIGFYVSLEEEDEFNRNVIILREVIALWIVDAALSLKTLKDGDILYVKSLRENSFWRYLFLYRDIIEDWLKDISEFFNPLGYPQLIISLQNLPKNYKLAESIKELPISDIIDPSKDLKIYETHRLIF